MANLELDDATLLRLEARLGIHFKNRALLAQAVVHRSVAETESNERLEFLGDAALELVTSELLFRRFPDHSEGRLTHARASLVNRTALGEVGRAMQLAEFIQLNRGEDLRGLRTRESVLGQVFEAVLGAVYLDQGIDALRSLVGETIIQKIDSYGWEGPARDAKSGLQEYLQAKQENPPVYKLVGVRGPDHDQTFTMSVRVGETVVASGTGTSKRQAEQEAARLALTEIRSMKAAMEIKVDALSIGRLESRLGVGFKDRSLLAQALVHRSFVNEANIADLESNERLEFLGDAVFDLVTADFLYRTNPDRAEGWLSHTRAFLVNLNAQGAMGASLGLGEFLQLGCGAELSKARNRPSVLGRTLEAVLGALYLDQGLEAVRGFLEPIAIHKLNHFGSEGPAKDYKSRLQEHLHAEQGITPRYDLVSVQGPDDHPVFKVSVRAGEKVLASGEGFRKRLAEQAAACAALTAILDAEGTTDVPAAS